MDQDQAPPRKVMRAKLVVSEVVRVIGREAEITQERVSFSAVAKSGSYPADGADEDNTFAKFSPQAAFSITIANPSLFETFAPGQKFYADFTAAEK